MSRPVRPILLVDDDQELLDALRRGLLCGGWDNVALLSDPSEVPSWLERNDPALVTLDLHMPGADGTALLDHISQSHPHIPVLVLTAADDLATAVRCMQHGARDYLVKPISMERLLQAVSTQMRQEAAADEILALRQRFLDGTLEHPEAFAEILTQSERVRRLFAYAEAVCRSGMPVLVTGETGTGKELMARALHKARHPNAPFVAVNVAGLDDAMFSDTLFGHVKGAFSGAVGARNGLVEKADGGTLFLDEIGDLAPESQVKLLRLLQEGEYYPLGSDAPHSVHLWVVAATHRPIEEIPGFRRDLYYRLQSHRIELPPLRERRGDVELLIRHACLEASKALGRKLSEDFAAQMCQSLQSYPFPGNIRELVGMVYDAAGQSRDGRFSQEFLERWHPVPTAPAGEASEEMSFGTNLPTLREATRALVKEALARTGDNRTAAAALLGISRQTLLNHLKLEPASPNS
jgi:DNA-binding NtrC family response regulator